MKKIICNNCLAEFKDEDDLILLSESNPDNPEDKTLDYYKGCPICKTDAYLMDLDREVKK